MDQAPKESPVRLARSVTDDRAPLSASSPVARAALSALRKAGADDPSVVGALVSKVPGKIVTAGIIFGGAFSVAAWAYMRLTRALQDAYYEEDEEKPVPVGVPAVRDPSWLRGVPTYRCSENPNHTQSEPNKPGRCGCGAPKEFEL